MLSFSGQLLETVSLYRDPQVLSRNFATATRLLSSLGKPEIDPVRIRKSTRQQWKGFLWSDIPASDVVDFLAIYATHPEAYKVNSALLSEFVKSMAAVGELTRWTVAVLGGGEGAPCRICDGVQVDMLRRAINGLGQGNRPKRLSACSSIAMTVTGA